MHALCADDQIAVTIVAMDEQRRDRRRKVLTQPAEREFEDRPRSFLPPILRVQVLNLSLCVEQRQLRKARQFDRMDRCRDAAELARELRPHRFERWIAQDLSRQCRACDPLHHESFAEPVIRREHVADFGDR